VRMYDTSNPYNWRYYKTVSYPFGRWTLTDADLSPDNKWLAYTSLASIVCLAPTDPNDTGDPYSLDLGYRTATSRSDFPIYSARFSGDGRNIVAGTGLASIIVYDIERRTRLHHVRGHNADVNAVAFADKLSPHILASHPPTSICPSIPLTPTPPPSSTPAPTIAPSKSGTRGPSATPGPPAPSSAT
jgi:DDB1- and CUL4-associated factor 11